MERTSETEYAALQKLSKANHRANIILVALFVVLLIAALGGGWSLYKTQRQSFDRLNASRLAASNHNLTEIRTMTIENIRYQTCIQVIPIAQRTPKAQRSCFKKADLPGGLSAKDFVTVPPEQAELVADTSSASLNASGDNSSSKRSTTNNKPQSNKSQPKPQPKPTPKLQPKPDEGILPDSIPLIGPLF